MKGINLIGKRFGKLTVIGDGKYHVLPSGAKIKKWECKCDCGNITYVSSYYLLTGHTKSCGCLSGRGIDLVGKRFGKLIVIEKSKNDGKWICKCDCGNITEVFGSNLKRNHTTSCGCIIKEINSKINYIHGGSKTKLYYIYRAMRNRCYRKKDINYKNYGGKGIIVCDEWMLPKGEGFKNFRNWANSNGYFEGKRGECTIERIDFKKNYCPENCTFIAQDLQAINKSNNKFIPFNGGMHTISEVSRATGILPGTISSRLRIYHMTPEQAIIPPKKQMINAVYFENSHGQIIAGADDPSTIDYNNYIPNKPDNEE